MSERVLLIVAAGKSSRFGGFPKAFCKIGETTNIENTIKQSEGIFRKVYVGVNKDTFERFSDQVENCEMFQIVPGQGDAHSLLKCIDYVKSMEPELDQIYVCWGDAVFVEARPLKQFAEETESSGYSVAVACAMDQWPYAWFDLNESNDIIKSHFASEEGAPIEEGMHDQSLFFFDIEFANRYLNHYREFLGIPYENDEAMADKNEMKLLFSFDFLREQGYELAKCISIAPDEVLSFNTREELETIKTSMRW